MMIRVIRPGLFVSLTSRFSGGAPTLVLGNLSVRCNPLLGRWHRSVRFATSELEEAYEHEGNQCHREEPQKHPSDALQGLDNRAVKLEHPALGREGQDANVISETLGINVAFDLI
jgi:hypothetical protein